MSDLFELAKHHFFQGLHALQSADYKLAEHEFERSLVHLPNRISTMVNLQAVLVKLGKWHEAISLGQKICAMDPMSYEAYLNTGNAYKELGMCETALDCYGDAIRINPNSVEIFNSRGALYLQENQLDQAESDLLLAQSIDPSNVDTLNNVGVLYRVKREYGRAMERFISALSINPNNAVTQNNLATLYLDLHEFDLAEVALNHAITLDDKMADVHYNLGNLYVEKNNPEAAQISYEKAVELDATVHWLLGRYLLTKAKLCDWQSFGELRQALINKVMLNCTVCLPFDLLCISGSGEVQMKCAELYANKTIGKSVSVSPSYRHHIPRIGYLSCDFREHAVSYLMAGVFEKHDQSLFDIFCYDTGGAVKSPTRDRISRSISNLYDVHQASDEQIASLIRSHEIDILVDLSGHTRGARSSILALRPAAIQVNYLGYPGTMGAPECLDYIIADTVLIKDKLKSFYSEKILFMPECFQANDSNRLISQTKSKSAYGLPDDMFIFGCFANLSKLNPESCSIWLSILKKVPTSVLWLAAEHPKQEENLRKFAKSNGVDSARLIFGGLLPYAEHLARYRYVDLVLDTMPFNGGTTTSDALWVGSPVLTCAGESFSGRMSASLLSALGLEMLIVERVKDYEDLAVELATNREKLDLITQRLAKNKKSASLFDTSKLTKNLEIGYKAMFDRQQAGLSPDHIYI